MQQLHYIRFITFAFLLSFYGLNAQQLPLFTEYREMQGVINPAAISRDFILSKHNVLIGTSYRRQWIDVPEAPATLMLNGEWLKDMGGSHLISGLYVMDDKLGKESTLGIYNRLGVLLSSDPTQYGFAMALSGGYVRYRVQLSEITARDVDPLIGQDKQKWHPDIGMGIFGYTKLANDAMIYGGFSIPQVFAFKAIELSEKTDIIRYRHYYLTGGYIIPFNSEGSTMEISTWTKFVPNTNPNVDLNVRFNYENMFQLGLGVNTNKSVALEASYTLGSTNDYEVAGLWRIGYCYNMNLSPIANYMGSSHEVHLSVAFGGN